MKTRLALLLSLGCLAGCVKNNASVRVAHVCAIPDNCAFSSGGCDTTYIGQIAIDLAVTNQMLLFLQVDNLLPNNGNPGTFKTNTNDAFIQEYEIEYEGFPGTFTGPVTGSATVLAATSTVVSVDVVSPIAASQAVGFVPAGGLDAVAKVRLKGVLADGSSFETGVYEVPFLACNGAGCANIALPTCTAPAVLSVCPNFGQLPSRGFCVG
jgi:hypothetical protein